MKNVSQLTKWGLQDADNRKSRGSCEVPSKNFRDDGWDFSLFLPGHVPTTEHTGCEATGVVYLGTSVGYPVVEFAN